MKGMTKERGAYKEEIVMEEIRKMKRTEGEGIVSDNFHQNTDVFLRKK